MARLVALLASWALEGALEGQSPRLVIRQVLQPVRGDAAQQQDSLLIWMAPHVSAESVCVEEEETAWALPSTHSLTLLPARKQQESQRAATL